MRVKTQLLVLMLGAFAPIACDPMLDREALLCMNRIDRSEHPHRGEMSALRNGEPWIVSPSRGSLFAVGNDESETMDIMMDVFDIGPAQPEYSCPDEQLYFAGLSRRLWTYPLPGRIVQWGIEQERYFFAFDHCNVPGSAYVLDESEGGFISIDAYDRSSCTIRGAFALTVIREKPGGTHPYVDTLRFTEGRFHTHVVTWPGAK